MKKYVKPLMESEAFVANEYVSTCYVIDCNSCAGVIHAKDGDSALDKLTTEQGVSIYTGNLGEYGPCKNQDYLREYVDSFDFRYETTYDFVYWILSLIFGEHVSSFHPVTVTDKGWDNHPNASI